MAWNEYRSITEHDTAPNVNWKKRFNLTETYSCGILCFFLPLDLSTYLCACIIITYLLFFSLLKQLWTFAHILFYTGAKTPKTKQKTYLKSVFWLMKTNQETFPRNTLESNANWNV